MSLFRFLKISKKSLTKFETCFGLFSNTYYYGEPSSFFTTFFMENPRRCICEYNVWKITWEFSLRRPNPRVQVLIAYLNKRFAYTILGILAYWHTTKLVDLRRNSKNVWARSSYGIDEETMTLTKKCTKFKLLAVDSCGVTVCAVFTRARVAISVVLKNL